MSAGGFALQRVLELEADLNRLQTKVQELDKTACATAAALRGINDLLPRMHDLVLKLSVAQQEHDSDVATLATNLNKVIDWIQDPSRGQQIERWHRISKSVRAERGEP